MTKYLYFIVTTYYYNLGSGKLITIMYIIIICRVTNIYIYNEYYTYILVYRHIAIYIIHYINI